MHQLLVRISPVAVLSLLVALTVAAHGAENNFYEQADKSGCASVITERGQEECARTQSAKDEACSKPVRCDFDAFDRLLAKYKEAKDRLDRGQVADADKEALKESVREMKERLERSKSNAGSDISVAQSCVDARQNVQKWFMETGIPLTERTRDDALRQRKDLLERLAEAQQRRDNAKQRRDANSSDANRSDYERANEEMRNAEKALEQFNAKYGRDVEHFADRLIRHYRAEKDSHEKPLTDMKNRVDNCKKIDNTSL